jgi:hypothetical protein
MAAVDYYLLSAARRAHRLRPGRPYVFGRDEGVDIVLQDALVSRRHAEVRSVESGGVITWQVADLGSRNGVLVNGTRIAQPTRLDDGNSLQIGGQVFKMHLLPPGGDPSSLGDSAPQISSLETMGPGVSLKDLAAHGATYAGQVTGGVLELLQFFQITSKTGRLDLVRASAPMPDLVWIVAGNPVHAQSAGTTGIDAVLALARTPPERFAFHADLTDPGRSISGNANGVFMEIARQLDEDARG